MSVFKLVKNQNEVRDRIVQFYEEFKINCLKSLPFDSFIVDFAVNDHEVRIVELNPFSKTTGISYRSLSWEIM